MVRARVRARARVWVWGRGRGRGRLDLLGEGVDDLLDRCDILEPQLLGDDLEIAHLVSSE